MSDPLDNVRVVLVSPIYGGNIGSVCRAMKNMGITDLALAAPRTEWSYDDARTMAYHASDVFDARKEHATLAEAVADCGLVAGTTARPGLYRSHAKSPRDWAPELLTAAATGRVALVFGPEDKGLDNDQLTVCTQIIKIPTGTKYTSINLAQAVMICCYELFVASGGYEPPQERTPEAPSEARERMFAMWREALTDIAFMDKENDDHMMLGLRRILSRGKLSGADVQILMGIAQQIEWCSGEVARLSGKKPTKSRRSRRAPPPVK